MRRREYCEMSLVVEEIDRVARHGLHWSFRAQIPMRPRACKGSIDLALKRVAIS